MKKNYDLKKAYNYSIMKIEAHEVEGMVKSLNRAKEYAIKKNITEIRVTRIDLMGDVIIQQLDEAISTVINNGTMTNTQYNMIIALQ